MRVACIQMCSGTEMAANIATLEVMVGKAAGEGATYIQTPEMTGLVQKNPKKLLEAVHLQDDDPVFQSASALARRLGVWLHIGSTPVRLPDTGETGKIANRAGLFSPDGALAATYDKIHMFDVEVDAENRWKESNRYQRGDKAVFRQIEAGGEKAGLGLSVCYDIRFAALYRDLALAGSEILTAPSCFTQPTGEAHWEVLIRARAIENGCFMIAAAQSGEHEDGRKTHGHSMVVDPWGRIVGQLGRDAPDFLVCEIDLEQVAEARRRVPSLANSAPYTLSE